MHSQLETLRTRLGELADIRAAIALLEWDQETYMPPKGSTARGKQVATLSAIAHRFFTAPELGDLLNELASAELGADDAALVSEALYDYKRATCLPESLVQEFAQEQSRAYHAWVKARQESSFNLFQPHLEKLLDMLKQKADLWGYEDSPYDALLENFERGMTAAKLRPLFSKLADEQSALVKRIGAAPRQPDLSWVGQEWNEQAQWDFTLRILADMGFDADAGRQDRSVHPFTTSFDVQDVRVTTRLDPRDPFSVISGSMHEGGHALFEQGFLEKDRRTLLAESPSLGIHESQSRLWENQIGRSLPFWRHYAPLLQRQFPGQLDAITAEQIYAAVNHVRPSLIRVEADECTYNLHIIVRFEIEVDLIEGRIGVGDVPEIWNEKMKTYLGIDVPDDARGCLQDIHWSHGAMGYFPTYALGNLYAAQLFDAAEKQIPDLWAEVESGNFSALLAWLRKNVHQHGRRKTAEEIVRDATGTEPDAGPYLRYLEKKYSGLYRL